MNYRLSQILASESILTAGTKIIDVDLIDPISRIVIRVDLVNNGSTPTGHPDGVLTKIELIDGSTVLYSAVGYAAKAVDLYDSGFKHAELMDWTDNSWVTSFIALNFGRYLFDEDMGFDPTKFVNPQLKITHDYALGGCTPDAANMRIWADCFDDKHPSFKGMLLNKEHYSYTLVSSGVTYVDLPTDYIIRKIIVQSRAADKRAQDQFYQLRLTEEFDKKIILDEYTEMLEDFTAKTYGMYQEYVAGFSDADGRSFYITPTAECKLAAVGATIAGGAVTEQYRNGGYANVAVAAGGFFDGMFLGFTPHGAVPILFGKQNQIEDWWDVTRLKNARLKITAGSSVGASSTCRVMTQQYKPY